MPLDLRVLARLLSPLVGLLIASSPLAGQAPLNSRAASRPELQASLTSLDRAVASTAYSENIRARAREQAAAVRDRLTNGDFRVGDRIHVRVVGPTQLVDSTLAVDDSLVVTVPGIKQVRLQGVLRSELNAVLLRELGEVVREVQVTSQPLLRVAVLGEVATPRFLAVAPDVLIESLLTSAGGPIATAALSKMEFVRGSTVVLDGPEVSAAIARGATLASLDLQDGDVLLVPARDAPWDRAAVMSLVGMFFTPILTLFVLR